MTANLSSQYNHMILLLHYLQRHGIVKISYGILMGIPGYFKLVLFVTGISKVIDLFLPVKHFHWNMYEEKVSL